MCNHNYIAVPQYDRPWDKYHMHQCVLCGQFAEFTTDGLRVFTLHPTCCVCGEVDSVKLIGQDAVEVFIGDPMSISLHTCKSCKRKHDEQLDREIDEWYELWEKEHEQA